MPRSALLLGFLLTVFFEPLGLSAQRCSMLPEPVVVRTNRYVPPPRLDAEGKAKVESLVQKAFDRYWAEARLFDTLSQGVSAQSIQRFKNLFNVSAKVMDDLHETAHEDINNSDYASLVYDLLNQNMQPVNRGNRFQIHSALINNMRYDSGHFYVVKVLVEKQVFNKISETGSRASGRWSQTGRCYIQTFQYEVAENLQEDALLLGIEGKLNAEMCQPPKDYPHYSYGECVRGAIGIKTIPYFRYGTAPKLSAGQRPFLDDKAKTQSYKGLRQSVSGSWGAGLALRATSRNKKAYLGLGAAIQRTEVEAALESVEFKFAHKDIDQDEYVHNASLGDVSETMSLSAFEVTPELGYALLQKNDFSLWLNLQPFFRFQSYESSLSAKKAVYKGNYTQYEWVAYGDEFNDDYGYDDFLSVPNTVSFDKQTLFGIRPGLSIQYNLNDRLGIEAGLEYERLFGTFLPEDSTDNHILRFRGTTEVNRKESILHNYYQNSQFSSLNLRFGILYNMRKSK